MYDTTRNLMNESQSAAYLGSLTAKTLQAWRVRGGGPAFIKVGRLVRYRQSDLDAWIESRRHESTSKLVVAK